MITRNDPCWCGSGKKWKKCHFPQEAIKTANDLSLEYLNKYDIILKNEQQIEKIRQSCKIAAKILDELCKKAVKGITTEALDQVSIQLHKDFNAIAAPLGYGKPPFPKTICTSLNEVICHGIPNSRPLQEGDLLNIDVTCIVNGFYGDCSRMVAIGEIDKEKKNVMDVSYQCLMKAISICKPGTYIYEIGDVIEDLAKKHGCSVVDQFVGHGIGVRFHEPPHIPHNYNNLKIPLAPGMIFTIEPMINAGVKDAVIDPIDEWTARTKDKKPSAQWEHTILINHDGSEILTRI